LVTQAGSRARLKIREIRAFRTEIGGRVGRSCGVVKRANTPLTMLFAPVVLFKSAPAPVAVLSAVLAKSVPAPTAVLKLPILFLLIEKQPMAVLYVPLARLRSAFCPCAVLPPT